MGRILATALFGSPDRAEFIIQDPDERISNVLGDRVDITIQFMSFSADRLREIAFSVPYYTEGIGLILGAKGDYRSYDDLVSARSSGSRITIAVLENPGADSEVDEILAGATAVQQKDMAMVYSAVESARVDAGMADLSSIRWLATHQPDTFVDSGLSTHPQNYGAAMQPDDQRWINFVNGVLVDAMTGASHGDYDAAFEAYFGEKLQPPAVGKPGPFRSA
jgi:polar amino acid transport system substrate-binding protein